MKRAKKPRPVQVPCTRVAKEKFTRFAESRHLTYVAAMDQIAEMIGRKKP